METTKQKSSFKGTLGFILAAAGSAVGLGNIWRFPYLAAKDGGGLFLVVYVALALTFGFTLLTTEIAIGRKTKKSPMKAYDQVKKGWKPLGILATAVCPIIFPYYCVIGGWVIKFLIAFIVGDGVAAAGNGYFTSFIGSYAEPILYMIVFMVIVAALVLLGVKKGIEDSSKVLMPVLIVLVIFISIYCLTVRYTDGGTTRTGLQGLAIYVVPDFAGLTFSKFLITCVDAMGQLFFSLSVAMGIMITYGSYVSDGTDLLKSVNQIEIFDTVIAFLAGVMVIPAVYTFMGEEGLSASGPGLMFISLPKVFNNMGVMGRPIGIVFFLMVLFAALTSAVSVLETVVSNIDEQFHTGRTKATVIEFIIAAVLAVLVCLGYNALYFEAPMPDGTKGQLLDILDFISNKCLMPVVAIGTCILVGWVVKPKTVIEELERNGKKFRFRRRMYVVMIKYVAPILLIGLFVCAFLPASLFQ